MSSVDYYELLGVSREATADQIKRAYRQAAKEYHPDVNPDPEAETRFKDISKAYEVLSDPQRRARYDQVGPEDGAGAGAGGFGPFGQSGLDDLLGMFMDGFGFGGGGRGQRGRPGPPRGADLEVTLHLAFEEAVFGAQKDVTIRTAVPCTDCEATGAAEGTAAETCRDCGGTGQLRRMRQSFLGQMVTTSPCIRCGGQGQMVANPCPTCSGEGRVVEERTYTVEIPAGVDHGTTLRLSGRGAVGTRGGGAGDLYVHVGVEPHAHFQRQGADLYHRLALPFTQATLGAVLPYETLDGMERLTISRGVQTGELIRLRGKGVPIVGGRGRGDLIIELAVETPGDLTDEQEDLLRKFAESRGEQVAEPEKGFFARLRSAMR